QYEKGIRRVIQDGIQQGGFRRGDVKLTAFALLGALNWVSKWYSPEGGSKSEAIAAAFADYLVGGLMAPSATAPLEAKEANGTALPPDASAFNPESIFAEESWLL